MKLKFSRQCFEKYSNVKSRENPSSGGSRVVPCGQRDTIKLTVAFRKFANAPAKRAITVTNIFIVVYMEFFNIFIQNEYLMMAT